MENVSERGTTDVRRFRPLPVRGRRNAALRRIERAQRLTAECRGVDALRQESGEILIQGRVEVRGAGTGRTEEIRFCSLVPAPDLEGVAPVGDSACESGACGTSDSECNRDTTRVNDSGPVFYCAVPCGDDSCGDQPDEPDPSPTPTAGVISALESTAQINDAVNTVYTAGRIIQLGDDKAIVNEVAAAKGESGLKTWDEIFSQMRSTNVDDAKLRAMIQEVMDADFQRRGQPTTYVGPTGRVSRRLHAIKSAMSPMVYMEHASSKNVASPSRK